MVIETDTKTELLQLFWMPGCSSCLRMKEFVEKLGVPFVAIDVNANPSEAQRLAALELSVPAAVLGNSGVSGVDLAGIAELIGVEYDPPPILAPAVLKSRFDDVIDVAIALFGQIPPEGLDYKSPDRDRTLRQLALHIATIMRGFTVVEETNIYTAGYEFMPDGVGDTGTTDDLIALTAQTRDDFDQWWDQIGYDDAFDRVLESNTRSWTLLEALERSVWHTVHHTRQIQYFLEDRLGITPSVRLTEEILTGLPLPDGIHG
jgi:glutaredoxin